MDEVPVWLDMLNNKTYNKKGAQNVPLKTTGNEYLRFTVALATLSDGRKCKPMMKKRCKVIICTRRSCNCCRTGIYQQSLDERLETRCGKTKTLLLMDSKSAHLSEDLKSSYSKWYNTDIVPGGMTSLIQPADVMYNKSFKCNTKRNGHPGSRWKTKIMPA
ncbi:pogo transposable element with KRAB domain-like protein [Leptotrombidium deliense]|uniref:Pogo transposable element with KRAB domain-like protein n=1 Tax=Leptotrombidium deliense TaxID=299467 RepID=A0A443RWP6_9ACAR|nr:pogo transposable element with KRAB domain-like protein [Leptotrombidium deliense]